MTPYGLRLYTGVLQGQTFVADVAPVATAWKRSIRAVGGFWQGSFTITGELHDLQWWMYETLGYHLEERLSNVVTWEGMIYELELSTQGVRRRRSLTLLGNAVKARYTDATTDVATETAFGLDTNSIARYGRYEQALTLGKETAAAAVAQRDTTLKELAWPWARPVSATPNQSAATLLVRACGYAFTMNWKFTSIQDAAIGNASQYVSDVIGTDCQFVSAGAGMVPAGGGNTLQVRRATALAARTWDTLLKTVALGDVSGNPWVLRVDVGRKAYYQVFDVTPRYYLLHGGLRDSMGSRMDIKPWLVRPGVVRDAQYPNRRSEPGNFLTDVRDMYVEEVEVDANGALNLHTSIFSEAAILDAQIRERTGWPKPIIVPPPPPGGHHGHHGHHGHP